MAGRSAGRPGRIRSALVVATALWAIATPLAAAEPSAQVLAGRVTSGVAVDLDGDGSREVVAVRPDVATPTLGLEAWRERDGGWDSIGSSGVLVASDATGDLRPGRIGADAGALLVVADAAGPSPILATAPIDGDGLPACCLTLFQVALEGGAPVLRLVGDGLGIATTVRAADLDGDGVDELIVTGPVDPAGPAAPFDSIQVLRRNGSRFVADPVIYPEGAGSLAAIGDSDGAPGDDLHFVTSGVVTRMTTGGAALTAERQPLADLINVVAGGWIAGATSGRIVAIDGDRSLATAAWPRGGRITALDRSETGPFPSVFLLGDGSRSRIVEMAGGFPAEDRTLRVRVHDLALRLEHEIVAAPHIQALWDAAVLGPAPVMGEFERARPMLGPVNGGFDDAAAFIGPGSLLSFDAAGRLVAHPARPYAGAGAMALAGGGSAWLVSGLGWNSLSDSVLYLIGGEPGTELRALPLESLTGAPSDGGPEVSLAGAAIADGPEGATLYVSDEGFSATVDATEGAWVLGTAAAAVDAGLAADEPVTLELHPERQVGDAATFSATIAVREPSGLVSVVTWEGMVLAGPPAIRVAASSDPFSASATVAGSVGDGASVMVDDRVVAVDSDGSFGVTVPAPIWGRDVAVVARDALGRESAERLTVFGVVDYRELPWLVIIGAVTVLIGVALFLRTPQGRQVAVAEGRGGDGRLEEIDGDQA